MFRFLFPNLYVPGIYDIDLEYLRRRGIRGLIFDLDNTIVERGELSWPPELRLWMDELKEKGFAVSIVSNNRRRSAEAVAEAHGIPAVFRAVKPRKKPFLKAIEMMGVSRRETAVVGDQIFTDVVGGNRLGLFTILINPLPGKEFIGTTLFSRQLERLLLPRIWRRHGFSRRPGHDRR
ncbi:MAG: YqeG family HAD IIIA-type phosphatase [Candidatus Desulforudis sp.]|nr:YqeG family HAD IIIA-type phosphatase [Desulforudis sp.]